MLNTGSKLPWVPWDPKTYHDSFIIVEAYGGQIRYWKPRISGHFSVPKYITGVYLLSKCSLTSRVKSLLVQRTKWKFESCPHSWTKVVNQKHYHFPQEWQRLVPSTKTLKVQRRWSLSYFTFNTLVWPLPWQIPVNYSKLNQTAAPCAAFQLDVLS